MKIAILAIAFLPILVLTLVANARPAHATFGNHDFNICQIVPQLCSPNPSATPSPSPEPTATPEPSEEPTASPSATPSATPEPTESPCGQVEVKLDVIWDNEEEPYPTATPCPTEEPGTPPHQDSFSSPSGPFDAPSGPQCGGITLAPQFRFIGRKDPWTVNVGWTRVDGFVNHYKIEYGLGPIPMWNTIVEDNHSEKDGVSTNLGMLPKFLPLFVRIAGYESSCIGPWSAWVDPS